MYIVLKNLVKIQRNNTITALYPPGFHQHKSVFLPMVMSLYYFYNRGHFHVPDSAECLNTNYPKPKINAEMMPTSCLSLDKWQCVELLLLKNNLLNNLKVIGENKAVLIIKSEFHSNLQSIEHFFSSTLFLKISNYMRFQNFIKNQAIISATKQQTERALICLFFNPVI